ncbi:hypothetical protein IIC68_04110, partial [archaeon]|nr:hypothetical protein [archaeon]
YTVKRSLSGIILGSGGLKVGQSITKQSEVIYDSKGIRARGSFSKRKRARIRYWGSNRDPRKYPPRSKTQ